LKPSTTAEIYFTQAGYREGITAGKEAFLQPGFDSGFAEVGAPLGRELGFLRGVVSALVWFLSSSSTPSEPSQVDAMAQVQDIRARLSNIKLSDLVSRDMEVGIHGVVSDTEKGEVDKLQEMLARLQVRADAGTGTDGREKEDLGTLRKSVEALCATIGLDIPMNNRA
jgi:hypothetical protein